MLKLHCIFNQTSVLPEVIRLVEKTAHSLNKGKKSAKVEDVYKEIRESGYEIDAESIAFAYGQTRGMVGRKNFSSVADLNRFGGGAIKNAIEIANKGDLLKVRLGKSSVNTSIAAGIAKTFSTLEGRNDVDKSRLVELQEKIRSVAAGLLDKKGYKSPITKLTLKETLEKTLDFENIGATAKESMKGNLKGSFDTIENIWEAVKKDVDTIASKIKDPAARSRFITMTDALRNSSYALLLGTKQSDDIVKQVLQKAGYVKEINVKGNPVKVVDWNKAMANQGDWKNDFYKVLRTEGFTAAQSNRIVEKLEDNYTKSITKQATNRLAQIQKKNGITSKVNKSAIVKLAQVRNAGLFNSNNQKILEEAMGFSIPQEVSDEVSQIIKDFESNIQNTDDISNKFKGEVERSVRNLLMPYQSKSMGKVVAVLGDYMALKAASLVVTAGNILQNVTSGINATFKVITTIANTRNPKILNEFLRTWLDTIKDASLGGVPVRDNGEGNWNQVLQGKGGLSDRWVIDNAKGLGGYFKAALYLLPQIGATAADAANGMVIFQSEMINGIKSVLKDQGKTGKEANRILDDILFGRDIATGKTNRELWVEEAKRRLKNQTGVKNRSSKAGIIADEIRWSDLTKYGITVPQIKAIMSASLAQKGKDLGHESDFKISPSTLLSAGSSYIQEKANKAKVKGNQGDYMAYSFLDMGFRGMNLFAGGIGNWAILTAQLSPIGIAVGLMDLAIQEVPSVFRRRVPIYRQKGGIADPDVLAEQLEVAKGIRSRFERGIYGTVIQGLGAAAFMAMMDDDDDDEKKKEGRAAQIKRVFNKYIADPRIKRLVDKAAPALLASELSFAYDPKTNKLDEKRLSDSWLLPVYMAGLGEIGDYYYNQVVAKGMIDRLHTSWSFANKLKTEDERAIAKAETTMMAVGEILQLPYVGWYNTERNEYKVLESGFTPDPKFKAKQKEEFKARLKTVDGKVDAFLNGMFTMQLYQGFKEKIK